MGVIGGVTPIGGLRVTKEKKQKTDHALMGVIGGVTPIRRPWVTKGLQKNRPHPHGCHRPGDTHQAGLLRPRKAQEVPERPREAQRSGA